MKNTHTLPAWMTDVFWMEVKLNYEQSVNHISWPQDVRSPSSGYVLANTRPYQLHYGEVGEEELPATVTSRWEPPLHDERAARWLASCVSSRLLIFCSFTPHTETRYRSSAEDWLWCGSEARLPLRMEAASQGGSMSTASLWLLPPVPLLVVFPTSWSPQHSWWGLTLIEIWILCSRKL